jgi:hypothetical protein
MVYLRKIAKEEIERDVDDDEKPTCAAITSNSARVPSAEVRRSSDTSRDAQLGQHRALGCLFSLPMPQPRMAQASRSPAIRLVSEASRRLGAT